MAHENCEIISICCHLCSIAETSSHKFCLAAKGFSWCQSGFSQRNRAFNEQYGNKGYIIGTQPNTQVEKLGIKGLEGEVGNLESLTRLSKDLN